MTDIGPITTDASRFELKLGTGSQANEDSKDIGKAARPDSVTERALKVQEEEAVKAAVDVEALVNAVSQTALSFSVDKELSRMVVAVRAVGSDEIIRQFPPEEFITVAKVIAAQNPDVLNEDFLKGILFDQYS